MIKINPYLNFLGRTEEAFNFYKSVFGGEFAMLQRFQDIPNLPNKDTMTPEELPQLMHVALPVGQNVLMGTDALKSLGHTVTMGNAITLSVSVDSKEEADRIFKGLGEGGTVVMPMKDEFWGAYFGMLDDKFGVKWMISYDKARQ